MSSGVARQAHSGSAPAVPRSSRRPGTQRGHDGVWLGVLACACADRSASNRSVCMLRLTELKLPLGHEEGALKSAILARLKIRAQDLVGFSVFRRATDARKRTAIALTYTLDVEVADEAALLKRFANDRNLSRAPDMN